MLRTDQLDGLDMTKRIKNKTQEAAWKPLKNI